jgi:hypothetical protein
MSTLRISVGIGSLQSHKKGFYTWERGPEDLGWNFLRYLYIVTSSQGYRRPCFQALEHPGARNPDPCPLLQQSKTPTHVSLPQNTGIGVCSLSAQPRPEDPAAPCSLQQEGAVRILLQGLADLLQLRELSSGQGPPRAVSAPTATGSLDPCAPGDAKHAAPRATVADSGGLQLPTAPTPLS